MLNHSLWKVIRIGVHYEEGDDIWVGYFTCIDTMLFITTWDTREEAWDWVNKPAILEGVNLHIPDLDIATTCSRKSVGKYPWK